VQGELPQRAAQAAVGLPALIEKLAHENAGMELASQVDQVIQMSGLIEHFKRRRANAARAHRKPARARERGEGVFARGESDLQRSSPSRECVLESGEGQADAYADSVQMMSCTRQGLEFPVVFPGRHGDGLVSATSDSIAALASLEEERRLCYVGDARHAPAVRNVRGAAPDSTASISTVSVPLHQRDAGGAGRGRSARGAGVAPRVRQAFQFDRGNRRRTPCAWAAGCAMRSRRRGGLNFEGSGPQARIPG